MYMYMYMYMYSTLPLGLHSTCKYLFRSQIVIHPLRYRLLSSIIGLSLLGEMS